ncbi:hypothetical protein [Martelella mediterranea]|uniref:hypothetical protein n=1 Tax=uncultured Martelella sp. TaxID=392331 RepID=UPI0011B26073|nr:hypothetical protein [uncultured Martelella sp.]
MNTATHESIVLIGGEGAVAQTLSAMLSGWSVGFFQADFSDSDTTMAAVDAASLILVAVDDDAPGPALACCGILKESDSGVSAPVAIVTPERADATLRLAALRAGADDVIGLEHNLATAAARISALLRFHALQGEAGAFEHAFSAPRAAAVPDETVRVLVVAEDASMRQDLLKSMLSLTTTVATGDLREALYLASSQHFDLVLVHGGAVLSDALRICGQLRCVPGMRFVPLFALCEPGALPDISGEAARSADDCMTWPGETGELVLRALLHLRRKRYVEALGAVVSDYSEVPETTESDTGLLAPERFATTLNALKREASSVGEPLYMGVVRVPEDPAGTRADAVAALIRYHLSGRDAASRVEDGLFAILYPDRHRDDAEQAIATLRQRLDANLAALTGEGARDALQPAADMAELAIRTALTEVN